MVKIKTKKQFTLSQLIQWAIDNDIKHRVFVSNPNFDGVTYKLGFDKGGDLYFEEALTPTLLFTVEVEEEITEDTRLDKLVVRYRNDDIYIFPQERIDDFKNDSSIVAFYIPNDDLTLTLIWRDGKLIE